MHPKGVNSMAASGLSFEQPLVGAGWAISRVLSINGPRKQWSHLAEPQIPVFKAEYFARASHRPSPEHLDRVHFNEWVWSES